MDFKDLVQQRRSHRSFDGAPVAPEDVKLILRAALMSPTSKGQRKWQFVVVDDAETINQLADAKRSGAQFLKGAPLAIVVMGNPDDNACWIEDGSIAAISMQYQAADLGLGSCWAQMRGRSQADGTPADEVIHRLLHLDAAQQVLCVVAFGHYTDARKPQDEERLKWQNVQYFHPQKDQ